MAKSNSDLQSEIIAIDPEAKIDGLIKEQLMALLASLKNHGIGDLGLGDELEPAITDMDEDEHDTVPDSDTEEIIDDQAIAEGDKPEVEQFIIIKSKSKGVVYGMPMPPNINEGDNTGKRTGGKGRSLFTQYGYNEVALSIWEELRKSMLKVGFQEYGRVVDKKTSQVTAKQYQDFTSGEQAIIAKNCNDVKALTRWKTLLGTDPSVMTVILEQLAKIRNWKPAV